MGWGWDAGNGILTPTQKLKRREENHEFDNYLYHCDPASGSG